ncbi:MAG: hypothetical protein AAFV36_08215, partial [Myxococcota bacterium]
MQCPHALRRRVEGRGVGVREAVAVQVGRAREQRRAGRAAAEQVVDVGADPGAGGGVDEGSAVEGEVGRVAEAEFGDGRS